MELLKKLGNYIWSKQFGINLGIIIVIYVVGFLILKKCLSDNTKHFERIAVPNLIGKNQNNLKKILGDSLEFEILGAIYDPSKVEGTILSQDPEATALTDIFVKSGRKIKVRVSKRSQMIEMPKLVDKSQRFAETILKSRGFRYTLEYKPSKEAHGAVLDQQYKNKHIDDGTRVPIGSKIKLIIGRDEAGVPQALPNLIGLTIEEARARVANMIDMDFQIACPEGYSKSDSIASRVETQSPDYSEDGRVASGSTILIFATREAIEQEP